jgi:hypothetical protein
MNEIQAQDLRPGMTIIAAVGVHDRPSIVASVTRNGDDVTIVHTYGTDTFDADFPVEMA